MKNFSNNKSEQKFTLMDGLKDNLFVYLISFLLTVSGTVINAEYQFN